MKRSITILFAGLIVFSFLFLALPNTAQAEEEKKAFGCCQFLFDGEPGGCMYPSDPESCGSGKLKGEYVEGADCNLDTGFCSGYKKDESTSSESGE